jgi:hypothetical protein
MHEAVQGSSKWGGAGERMQYQSINVPSVWNMVLEGWTKKKKKKKKKRNKTGNLHQLQCSIRSATMLTDRQVQPPHTAARCSD